MKINFEVLKRKKKKKKGLVVEPRPNLSSDLLGRPKDTPLSPNSTQSLLVSLERDWYSINRWMDSTSKLMQGKYIK